MDPMLSPDVVIRLAGPADTAAMQRLAALDSAAVPEGELLVAVVRGELWAALSLDSFESVADPFRPTGELVFLLVERGRQLRRHVERRTRRRQGGRRLAPRWGVAVRTPIHRRAVAARPRV
jgi:hypothetical protein